MGFLFCSFEIILSITYIKLPIHACSPRTRDSKFYKSKESHIGEVGTLIKSNTIKNKYP